MCARPDLWEPWRATARATRPGAVWLGAVSASAANGTLEYLPSKREIRAKCRLFRTIEGWDGAAIRMPRDGEYAIATTAGWWIGHPDCSEPLKVDAVQPSGSRYRTSSVWTSISINRSMASAPDS